MGVLPGVLRSRVRAGQHRRGAVHATKKIVSAAMLAVAAALFGLHFPANAMAQSGAPEASSVIRAALPEARPAGAIRFTSWGFDIYDASLWVTPGFRADNWSQRPLALEMRYLRSFDGDDIAKRSLDEMRRVNPMPEAQAAQWLRAMKSAFPNVKKGDRLLGVYDPEAGARFFHNGTQTAMVGDAQFAQRFFAIWLAPQTSEPAMRDALLAPVK
ncbi:MAG: hypothetical protein EOO26_00215 [Comamonadaceae bacterium]|nr:MAG: hypothetical protein EOO26_00215 [Comamonadaceae bacterium]